MSNTRHTTTIIHYLYVHYFIKHFDDIFVLFSVLHFREMQIVRKTSVVSQGLSGVISLCPGYSVSLTEGPDHK